MCGVRVKKKSVNGASESIRCSRIVPAQCPLAGALKGAPSFKAISAPSRMPVVGTRGGARIEAIGFGLDQLRVPPRDRSQVLFSSISSSISRQTRPPTPDGNLVMGVTSVPAQCTDMGVTSVPLPSSGGTDVSSTSGPDVTPTVVRTCRPGFCFARVVCLRASQRLDGLT
jgi:hypothetical protein